MSDPIGKPVVLREVREVRKVAVIPDGWHRVGIVGTSQDGDLENYFGTWVSADPGTACAVCTDLIRRNK